MQAIFVSILQCKSSVDNSFFDNRYYVLGVSTSFGLWISHKISKYEKIVKLCLHSKAVQKIPSFWRFFWQNSNLATLRKVPYSKHVGTPGRSPLALYETKGFLQIIFNQFSFLACKLLPSSIISMTLQMGLKRRVLSHAQMTVKLLL